MGSAALRVLEEMTLGDLVQRMTPGKTDDSTRPLISLRRVVGAKARELP
jgi:hypothetical protein